MKTSQKYSRFVTNPPPRSVMENEPADKTVAFDLNSHSNKTPDFS